MSRTQDIPERAVPYLLSACCVWANGGEYAQIALQRRTGLFATTLEHVPQACIDKNCNLVSIAVQALITRRPLLLVSEVHE